MTTLDASKRSGDKKLRKGRSQLGKDSWFRKKMNVVQAAESRSALGRGASGPLRLNGVPLDRGVQGTRRGGPAEQEYPAEES